MLAASSVAAQPGNGRLQIHFMHVGQGDGALLISPGGETVLFDSGVRHFCFLPLSYLSQLGVDSVDYHVASHYHDDHIGCADTVLRVHPVRRVAFDRGGTYTTDVYQAYITRVGTRRQTATPGTSLRLDSNTAHPVTIDFRVVNGLSANGSQAETNNENDFSVVAVVHFGQFDAVFGGDLSGERTSSYRDVETGAAASIGPVEVYKVNHHGSSHSSNAAWLGAITPVVGVISAGANNTHRHPKADAMARLHQANVRTYWTSAGSGETQPTNGQDVVGGNIVVEVAPGSPSFTVTHSGTQVHTYSMIGAPADVTTATTFAWSKRSNIYHLADCVYVRNISPANLMQGNTPPSGKSLHQDCPRHGDDL